MVTDHTPLLLALALLASCGQNSSSHKTKRIQLKQTGNVKLVLSGVSDVQKLKKDANLHGISAEGDSILILKGNAEAISGLDIPTNENFNYIIDEPVKVEKSKAFSPDRDGLYLAKKDFGIFEFRKTHPGADGRGVIVGVMDDGISPHQDGFRTTSTGERKFISKNSQSSFTTFDLIDKDDHYSALVDENRPTFSDKLDLDKNGVQEVYEIKVSKELDKACWMDQCKGSFSLTGDYFTASDARFAIMIEIDKQNKKLKVFQPETGDDSHGEGVASVMAGHRIGNIEGFDGVAPGAKITDYDLSELTDQSAEQEYTVSTFLKGLDWLGSQGAAVVNISYSIFFTSAETQIFMRDALAEIINKHNMVISFSAGNNGPGLGSLNRRSMYPDSALVAGAFVSKELDERVHGVTGIPEEGRVIFYSSRGPGQGAGPTLISPLSSLTNSSPDEGHRAFNGTSSASPALAGAAAVLISAIKQEGLTVHAPSVVHALRLSGQRLKAEPFIFQGNGLPKLGPALALYKKIIAGEIFENVIVEVGGSTLDGVYSKGFTVRTSQTSGFETRTVYIKGIASALAPADKKVNLLVPLKLKYSEGITGPRELWVSSGENSFSIDVDVDTLLGNEVEAFGEVTLIPQNDDTPLATIPVTVVRDVNVQKRPSFKMKISAQEGKRFHIYVPEGIKAFRVRSEYLENPNAAVSLSVFDTNQVRIKNARAGNEIWVQVDRAGHYQIGVALNRGTARGSEVGVNVEPISIQLRTSVAEESDPKIALVNGSRSPFFGILNHRKIDEVIHSQILSSSNFKDAEFAVKVSKGSYRIAVSSASEYDISYPYFSCSTSYINEESSLILSDKNDLLMDHDAEVTVRCMPFEMGMKGENTYRWLIQLLKVSSTASTRLDLSGGAKKQVKLEGILKGRYVLELQDPLNESNVIQLGNLDVQ